MRVLTTSKIITMDNDPYLEGIKREKHRRVAMVITGILAILILIYLLNT
jgi:hypothetical protein